MWLWMYLFSISILLFVLYCISPSCLLFFSALFLPYFELIVLFDVLFSPLFSLSSNFLCHFSGCFRNYAPLMYPSLPLADSLIGQLVKNLPAMQETQIWFLGGKDPLEKEIATYSSILAWRIPWTEEPGRLQSVGLQRDGLNLVTKPTTFRWYYTVSCIVYESYGNISLFLPSQP